MLIPDHPPHPGSASGQPAAQGKARDGTRRSPQSGLQSCNEKKEVKNRTEYLIYSPNALPAKTKKSSSSSHHEG